MNLLGLSFDYHDSAAAIIADGVVVAAAQEERFSRKKNDQSFPKLAIEFCLKEAGIEAKNIDHVVFYERPLLKFDRIIWASLKSGTKGLSYLNETLKSWINKDKFSALERIATELDISQSKVSSVSHHESHAASAFYCSPFDEATVVTLDGVGEYETASVSIGQGNKLKKLYSVKLPESIGLLYSAFTAYLGFRVNSGEYKVMGMAAFGEPNYKDKIKPILSWDSVGRFKLKQKYFDFLTPEKFPFTEELIKLFGPPREPESEFRVDKLDENKEDPLVKQCKHYADIAASLQSCTEDFILEFVSRAKNRTSIDNICMAGGVALNSLANGKLQRDLGFPFYIQPAAGDSGCALGAALYYWYNELGKKRTDCLKSAYLGRTYTDEETEKAIKASPFRKVLKAKNDDELVNEVADRLASGKVIGWAQGRFEWGPRALGARSIIADPTRAEMKQVVNEKIKFREPFRPFAPSALEDRAHEFFDLPNIHSEVCPEHFMLSVCPVRKEAQNKLPAITHIDGSARVQLVRKDTNPIYYKLIEAFGKRSGVPVVLNTSFNLRGEPIVSSPADAIKTFSWCDMDSVIIGSYIIDKD